VKDTRRLSDRIGKLARAEAADTTGRLVDPGADGTSLAAILREVDETVLPRRLVFRRGDGVLTVVASNRRLISVDTAEGPGAGVAADILGVVLNRPDVAMLGQLRAALSASLPGTAPIRVLSLPPTERIADFASGTTAAALALAWGVDLSPAAGDLADPPAPAPHPAPAPGTPLDGFLARVGETARAWLRLDAGSVVGNGGERDLVARLEAFAGSDAMADLDTAADPATRRFVAIGRAPDDGDCLLLVGDGPAAALLLLPSAALDAARKTWAEAAR